MTLSQLIKWIAGALGGALVLAALLIAVFGWNWLRSPIERIATEKTGRVLAIQGDLKVQFAWPWPRIHVEAVTFANPPWAKEKQMLTADAVTITVDLQQLLRQKIVLTDVRLTRPVVFLEQGTQGRKSWLLDLHQQDESARIQIDRLTLDHGTLGYDDAANKTSIRSEITSAALAKKAQQASVPDAGVVFSAQGQYKGLALKAHGSGGAVLAIRDEHTPYPLTIDATIGHTGVRADGTVTSLLKFSAVDMQLALTGDSLDQLFPLLGIAFPVTPAYAAQGHLLHSGTAWRYDKFSGRIGGSDIAGSMQVDTGGPRTVLIADLVSNLLDFDDLGPVIGSRPASVAQAAAQTADSTTVRGRVLPEVPFKTDRWGSVDAQVTWRAKTIRRAKALPLEDFDVHLSLRDSVLKLDPLHFGVAAGQLNAVISLDGRKDPIQAQAQLQARKIHIDQLFPTVELTKSSTGQINGAFDLTGTGNSVAKMLATSKGKLRLVIVGGEISKLMMEKVGLHLWEILQIKVTGDKPIKLRCGVADFDVQQGLMQANALFLDTEVTTINGSGTVDLGQELLNLTLNPKTKDTSPLALRSPIYVRGSFASPVVSVDKGRVATRALGALALGTVNPLLALIPLIDAGPGGDSDCAQPHASAPK
ncbi:MAG: hypothetical protein RIR09_2301 [Pseudomonadota bacterium]